jgi:Lon-like protease
MPQAINPNKNTAKTRPFPWLTLGLSWLALIPGLIWMILTYYLPVFGGTLTKQQAGLATPLILFLFAFSILIHVGAHVWTARALGLETPGNLTILFFGDVAQSWPPGPSPSREFLSAMAGPVANLLLGGLAYLMWSAQLSDFLGISVLLAGGFNGWLFIINLIPAFPMDGGRLIRGSLEGRFSNSVSTTSWLRRFGFLIAAALVGWSFLLIAQNARFSMETAEITLILVILVVEGLWTKPAQSSDEKLNPYPSKKNRFLASLEAGFLVVALSAAALTLLLTNNGLDAPGVSLPIESMIQLPPQYHHTHPGSFFLVTVISETPITAGEWFLGQIDPAITIVPPETVVPKNTTPQEQAKQGYQQLDDSETTAIAVGLQLAGYPNVAVGRGVQVVSILPGSHAQGVLQSGDVITALNGTPVRTTSDLISLVKAQSPKKALNLHVQRGQSELDVIVPLMAPATPTDSPKIGIAIQSAGIDYKPPFPVSIVTQKINGGPSAGLMFTLTVLNALSTSDLAGGHKIAGTGTINLDGTVGPIGGVKQKIFAAEGVGAEYFLCPVDNYADAASVAKTIKVIKIATAQQAIDFLHGLPPRP